MPHALPLLVSLLAAAAVAPAAVEALRTAGRTRVNYRGAPVAFPAGIALVAAALVALAPLALLRELAGAEVFRPGAGEAIVFVLGVALLGLIDDVVGGEGARGLRGHAAGAARGRFSSGVLKAVGTLGLALYVLGGQGLPAGEYGLAVALLVLATHLFNLLDLRPGRSIKALVLLGAGLTLGSFDLDPLWALGLFLGPILVLLPLDLRERGMLGDTGSGAVGAVAGVWLVLTLSPLGQAIALAVIAVLTVYGEFRSISAFIERTPGLRHLDSLGRSHA